MRKTEKLARTITHILTLAHIFSMRSVCTKSCLLVVKWCETITAVIQLIGNIQEQKCLELSSSAGRSDTVPRQQHLPHCCCHIQQGTKLRTLQRLRTWLHSKRKELTAHMFICKAASYRTSRVAQLFLKQKLLCAKGHSQASEVESIHTNQ